MPEKPNLRLHLPSLSIKGFRGIRELDIPRLGRVTLLAGKNGVGKTAALEAVRLYAARGRERVLSALLKSHEEFVPAVDRDEDADDAIVLDPAALFHGRNVSPGSFIEIGPRDSSSVDTLKIEITRPDPEEADNSEKLHDLLNLLRDTGPKTPPLRMKVSFADRKRTIPWFFLDRTPIETSLDFISRLIAEDKKELPSELNGRSLDPGLLSNAEVAELLDKIALTDDERRAVEALNLVLGGGVDRVAMVGDGRSQRSYDRRVVVKLRDRDRPVPLRSLGDGAARLFGVALALAGSRGGFLVIDEVENGIHHSVQGDFWRMVLRTAQENDVQVFAATHSFDCVRGFAQAVAASPNCDGVLVRLEQDGERTRAVVYSDSALATAAEQNIEVR